MLKKTSADAKKTHRFFHRLFIDFSRKIIEKSCKTHENHPCAQITRGTLLFSKKTIFNEFLASPWVPRGLLGRPGKFPKSLIFLIHGQLRLKTTVDGLREASGRPPRCLQAPPGYEFASIFGSILHVRNQQKMSKSVENNSENLEELVTLMRGTMNS